MLAADNRPIRRTSLVDEIAGQLQREILEGRYLAGEALPPERELAERYGVTRTSLKHALVRLEQMGLIETRHGVGSVVQNVEESGGADLLKYMAEEAGEPNLPFLREILEARTLIVGAFVRLAARRRSEEDLAELEGLLADLDKNPDDPRAALAVETGFFRVLARASGNRTFIFLTNSVTAAAKLDERRFAEPLRERGWVKRSLQEIFDAIEAREAGRASKAAEEYFEESTRRTFEQMKRGGRTSGRKTLRPAPEKS